jgi:hypothetical protein
MRTLGYTCLLWIAACSHERPTSNADAEAGGAQATRSQSEQAGQGGVANQTADDSGAAPDAGSVKVEVNQDASGAGGAQGRSSAGGGAERAGASGAAGAASRDAGQPDVTACPGVTEPARPLAQGSCTRQEDCPAQTRCGTTPPAFGCGPVAPRRRCPELEECTATQVCVTDSCGGSKCAPACTPTSCPATTRCSAGTCVAIRCDEPGGVACPDRYTCDPVAANTGPTGCRPKHCSEGASCELGWDCAVRGATQADAFGCVHRRCSSAADCDCGSCVLGQCEPYPGACFSTLQPP